MSFFRVQRGKLEFDRRYILMNKPFAKIVEKLGEEQANKVFRYIYEVADNRSYSNKQAVSDLAAHEHGINLAGLDSTFKPSKLIKDAITYYKQHNYNLHADTLKELKQTLNQTKRLNTRIRVALDNKLNSDEGLDTSDITSIMGLQNKLFDLINELPNKIKTIKKLEATVYEELMRGKEIGRGGAEIPDSYEGDPEIEGAI